MNIHEKDPGQAATSPVELEIQFSPAASPAGLGDILATLNSGRIESVTLLPDPPQEALQLASLKEVMPTWRGLHTVNIRCTTAIDPDNVESLVDLHCACQRLNLPFHVDFIVDKRADGFDVYSQKTSVLSALISASRLLIQHQVKVRWLIEITSTIAFRIEAIYLSAMDAEVEPLLVLPEFMGELQPAEILSANEKLFVWDFITYRVLEADLRQLQPEQRAYYCEVLDYLDGQGRGWGSGKVTTVSAASESWTTEVNSVACASLRRQILAPAAASSGVAAISPEKPGARLHEIGRVLADGVRAHLLRTMVGNGSVQPLQENALFNKVLLIGAYGGEHIGDAAILGGVLCRLHERFGTTKAVLMTQRPKHTRHLVQMLDVPVSIAVDAYERPEIQRHLADADCVVFAGGPLIDLPKQLVRHLYAVSLARKLGKPFVAEGIGPGPFARMPSRFTARRLLEMANRISVRTSDSSRHEVVEGLEVEVGRCPAFDYLATRGDELNRMPQHEYAEISRLIGGTEGRPVIGINIRPVGHLYTSGAPVGEDVAAYTRRVERRFEHRLAEGLRSYDQQCGRKPCFIFFPMNAIQFGSSDILSAYRLQRILGSDVDLRVWQADASLDGVVALLRQVDVAITMRFHATVFALSQNCKVIGVDYRIGKRDKVAELLDDVGQGENCARIDLLSEGWLARRLLALTA